MGYFETIRVLFTLLAQANKADHADRKAWQIPSDSHQTG